MSIAAVVVSESTLNPDGYDRERGSGNITVSARRAPDIRGPDNLIHNSAATALETNCIQWGVVVPGLMAWEIDFRVPPYSEILSYVYMASREHGFNSALVHINRLCASVAYFTWTWI